MEHDNKNQYEDMIIYGISDVVVYNRNDENHKFVQTEKLSIDAKKRITFNGINTLYSNRRTSSGYQVNKNH